MRRDDWKPNLSGYEGPVYLALVNAIARDVDLGLLAAGDMLPPQRALARKLGLDTTTIARAYVEAASRSIVEARVGAGTFVRARSPAAAVRSSRRDLSDRSMNQAPEPDGADLQARMREDWRELGADLTALLRYQPAGGSAEDKAAALRWLSRRGVEAQPETLIITAGAHAALFAVLAELAPPGDAVACEQITYPGVRAIAQALGIRPVGLRCDSDGIDPAAFAEAAAQGDIRALYVNPTLRNPTTETVPAQRRAELIEVARRYGVMIIEDDAYGLLLPDGPPPFAMMSPEITYYVAGLAKTMGAGLRLAHLIAPSPRLLTGVSARLRAATVMACPLTTSLASRWIEGGVADAILTHIQTESRIRQHLVRSALPSETYLTDPNGFHVWIRPPAPWTRGRIVDWMRGQPLGAVAADAFCVGIEPPEALRLCLGGAVSREDAEKTLHYLADAFAHPPNLLQNAF